MTVYCWFVMAAFVVSVWSPLAHAQPSLRSIDITTQENGSELLKFNTNEPITVSKSFALSNPNRIVIDVPRLATGGVSLPKNYAGALVKSVRFGQFDAATTRIVLDVHAPAKIVATNSGNPFTVEIISTAPLKAGAKPVAEEKKPLIVIDAGHGGQDPGAIGVHKTQEKDITLNYAKALREGLLRTGRYRVALTREDDRFIVLPERVSIARKMKADMFISLHADSNPRAEARGFSIYTLSETASDDESAALAERENKADIIPGIDLSGTDADVASILIDLTQRETMNKSAKFADIVVDNLHRGITKLPKTHRYAGFRVLKAPDIPSVLIEVGFLSNEQDERLLLTSEYRERVVSSLVKGIDRFYVGE